ncbi:hypothetical protein J1614_001251 [Plenodomus biglobosus]|nr:hypothetical protein J1614_001251 [Plenodomus biglobosus]
MLKKAWDAHAFDDGINYQAPYQANGDVRVEPPSKQDKAHVEKYCARKLLEVNGRDAIKGLLHEEPYERGLLIPRYVVKEPELARVLMEDHYQVYKTQREMQTSGTMGTGVRQKRWSWWWWWWWWW